MTKRIIAVDFDGVIHKYSKGWQDGSIYDIPVEDSKAQLGRLVSKGYTVVIFTTRLNLEMGEDVNNLQEEKINQWLEDSGFEEGVHYHKITALKPKAIAYIDDRAIRFTDWKDVGRHF